MSIWLFFYVLGLIAFSYWLSFELHGISVLIETINANIQEIYLLKSHSADITLLTEEINKIHVLVSNLDVILQNNVVYKYLYFNEFSLSQNELNLLTNSIFESNKWIYKLKSLFIDKFS